MSRWITKVADSVSRTGFALSATMREPQARRCNVGNTAISTLNLLFDNRAGSDPNSFPAREGSIMEALDRNTSFVRNA